MLKENMKGIAKYPTSIEGSYPELTGIIFKRLMEDGFLND